MAGIAKIIYEFSVGSTHRLKEDYRFAREFLGALETNPKLHHLAVERGYYAIAGATSMKLSEIKYFISLSGAERRLKDFVLARGYVELNERSNKIGFRSRYKQRWPRAWRKAMWVTIYIGGCFLAFSPLLMVKPMDLESKYLLLVFFTLPCFVFFAVDALRPVVQISRGEALVKEQQEHAPVIYVSARS
jgi:hypothetical protein